MPTGALGQEPRFRNLLLECEGITAETGTGTCSSSAVTISDYTGLITTEALTTAQNAIETITLTNTKIAVGDLVFVTVANGTNSAGTPMLGTVTPSAGACEIKVINKHATAVAFNGTLKIGFMVVKAL
jgi:hypothetical protein